MINVLLLGFINEKFLETYFLLQQQGIENLNFDRGETKSVNL